MTPAVFHLLHESTRLFALLLLVGTVFLVEAAVRTTAFDGSTAVKGVAPFYPNHGQFAPEVLYVGRDRDTAVLVGEGKITVWGAGSVTSEAPTAGVSVRWLNTATEMRCAGETPSETRLNYLVGNNPDGWITDLPTFHKVRMNGAYSGIDVVLYYSNGELEFDYLVEPHADPKTIRWVFESATGDGARAAGKLGSDGRLHLGDIPGSWALKAPIAYQESGDARRWIPVRYVALGNSEWGLELGEYDRSLPLVIDPVLSYASYHGGSQFDQANAVTTDAANLIYVVGETWSLDLGVLQPVQAYKKSGKDAFILKLAADGRTVLSTTYFGGNGDDIATSIQVRGGDIFVAGETTSGDLPGTAGGYQPANGGGKDGFITRIRLEGAPSVQATTYFGGVGADRINSLILDATGNPYVAGYTASSNFPISGSFGVASLKGTSDAFVARFSRDLGSLTWSGIYGGSGSDQAYGLALGAADTIWFTGATSSPTLPMVNPLQTVLRGSYDCFLAQTSADGTNLLYSSFLGGSASEFCYAIATDGAGNPIVTGSSASTDFPVTPGVYQPLRAGNYDNIVAKLDISTRALAFATYLGGIAAESPSNIYVDSDGAVCIAGNTQSSNFPTANPVQPTLGGGVDGFLSCLNADATNLMFSTYLGGAGEDRVLGVVRRADPWTVLVGLTQSTNFPLTGNARQPLAPGNGDAFVVAISRTGANVYPANVSVTPSNGNTETAHLTYLLEDGNGFQDIRYFYANIHNAVSTIDACYTRYDTDSNTISLLSDNGGFWVGSAVLGEAKTLSNSQCAIDASRSSVWGHATRLSVKIHYSFRPGFGGVKSLLMYVQDRAGKVAGWQLRGGWAVPKLAGNIQPVIDYFQPNTGTFPSSLFVLRAVDANGANDLKEIHFLANDSLSYANSCYVLYNQSSNQLRLLSDNTGQFLGPLTPGVAGAIQNSSCILSAGYSAVAKSGDALTLSVYLTFKDLAAGLNNVWTFVTDQSNVFSGWRMQGTFTVPIGPAYVRPSADSVSITPSDGGHRFTLRASDMNGGDDVKDFYFLVNETLTNGHGCYILVRRLDGVALLLNDAGNAWAGSGLIGANTFLENSQCRVNLSALQTAVSGTTAEAAIPIQFKAGFTGAKSIWLYVEDSAKLISGWVRLNSVTLGAP